MYTLFTKFRCCVILHMGAGFPALAPVLPGFPLRHARAQRVASEAARSRTRSAGRRCNPQQLAGASPARTIARRRSSADRGPGPPGAHRPTRRDEPPGAQGVYRPFLQNWRRLPFAERLPSAEETGTAHRGSLKFKSLIGLLGAHMLSQRRAPARMSTERTDITSFTRRILLCRFLILRGKQSESGIQRIMQLLPASQEKKPQNNSVKTAAQMELPLMPFS